MNNTNRIAEYIKSLPRQEAAYASAFAHWMTCDSVNNAIEASEGRRIGIRKSRAQAIRAALLEMR